MHSDVVVRTTATLCLLRDWYADLRFQNGAKRPRFNNQHVKARDARQLATQTSSKAFKHGELDVDKFVKSREYEIRALEQGLIRSKKALTQRAFQQVPKELRRRTASHNVKRIPKRLQARGKREVRLLPVLEMG